jgi:hypothetical protein
LAKGRADHVRAELARADDRSRAAPTLSVRAMAISRANQHEKQKVILWSKPFIKSRKLWGGAGEVIDVWVKERRDS